MRALTVCFIFVLVGCEATISKSEIVQAQELCSDNGGVKEIKAIRGIYPVYICENGVEFDIKASYMDKRIPGKAVD